MFDLPDPRPRLERLFRRAAAFLAANGIRPNQLTLISMWNSAAAGILAVEFPYATWPLLAILAAMLVRLACDRIDGIMTCEHGLKTRLGGLLHEIATPVEDIALYLPLALRPELPAALVVGVVLAGALVEVAGLSAVAIGSNRRHDGPMTKVMRCICFAGLALAIAAGLAPGQWVPATLLIVFGLLAVTALNRLTRAIKEVQP
jgi:CDP-diacylglycerol--glycerol-3-phosphate 3-phosphatidyltransferase